MRQLILIAIFSFTLFAQEVTVSILPQKFFVEKIAGDKVIVNVMVKPGFSPATYEPKTSQMRSLASSELYFSIGVAFEDVWIKRFKSANKNLKVIDTSKGIEKLEIAEHSHEHEEHGHDDHDDHKDEKHEEHGHDDHDDHKDAKHEEHGHDDHDDHKDEKHEEHGHDDHDDHKDEKHDDHEEHADEKHEGLDPHIWLDPILVKVQAKNIYTELVKIDSKNKEFYKANYKKFLLELDSLDKKIKNVLHDNKNRTFMVFHPSWGYFAKRYNLEQIAVEVSGKEPKPKELIALINEAKEEKIKTVFVAPQFSTKAAKLIAKSINGKVLFIDPLSDKYYDNLIKTAKVIKQSND